MSFTRTLREIEKLKQEIHWLEFWVAGGIIKSDALVELLKQLQIIDDSVDGSIIKIRNGIWAKI